MNIGDHNPAYKFEAMVRAVPGLDTDEAVETARGLVRATASLLLAMQNASAAAFNFIGIRIEHGPDAYLLKWRRLDGDDLWARYEKECRANERLRARVAELEATARDHICPPSLGVRDDHLRRAEERGAESMRERAAAHLRQLVEGADVSVGIATFARLLADQIDTLPLTDATESEER